MLLFSTGLKSNSYIEWWDKLFNGSVIYFNDVTE